MIGILDSGIGGLSTYLTLSQQYPTADIVYLADQARLPYGNKSPKALISYLEEALDWFAMHEVERVLLACGTLSSVALEHLRKTYPFPLCDIVSVGVCEAITHTSTRQAILLGTEATIAANTFSQKLQEAGFERIYTKACPMFVPLVEQGICQPKHPSLQNAITTYLQDYQTTSADVLLLGCTHYHFLKKAIATFLPDCHVLDCGQLLALSCPPPKASQGLHLFYTTGHLPTFAKQLKSHIRQQPAHIAKTTLQ